MAYINCEQQVSTTSKTTPLMCLTFAIRSWKVRRRKHWEAQRLLVVITARCPFLLRMAEAFLSSPTHHLVQKTCSVVESLSHVQVFWPESSSPDGQRSLQKSVCLGKMTTLRQRRRKGVFRFFSRFLVFVMFPGETSDEVNVVRGAAEERSKHLG